MTTVVVTSFFEEEYIRRFREVDDRLEVIFREDLVPPPRWGGDHKGPGDWKRSPEQEEEFLGMIAEAEVLFDFPSGHVEDLTKVAPKLRWLQGSMAGAGEVSARANLQDTDVTVATASGVFSSSLAEFVLAGLLSHAKVLDSLRRDKHEKLWREDAVSETLRDKTLCIVGMGSIGRAIAGLAKPFGMRILGVKRTIREDDPAREHADDLYTTEHLRDALGEADYVVVTLPSTPETEHLLDEGAIRSMKPGAYFVNVGRGKVVDEGVLVEALEDGHLSGAALDVFEEEPLPEESPLWELGNVIISPHATDNVPALTNLMLADLFCDNLCRYMAGEDLLNVLDKRLLY